MAFKKEAAVIQPVINCHCYNAAGTMCALCPNTKEILIYDTKKSGDFKKWEKLHTLHEHDQKVTCIDWAPKSNQILTCSEDRNAYVWHFEEDKKTWKPTLVLVRINRAALVCKWSPAENKFAVGSGAKVVSVCFFGKEQNWWVSNIVKRRFKSSVVDLSWHPEDNTILACASTDGKCRVISTFIKKVDKGLKKSGAFGKVLYNYDCGGWVHSCAWSPSGEQLAWVGHDSSVYIVPYCGAPEDVTTVNSTTLPFKSVMFLSETKIVAGGWNYSPVVFEGSESGWKSVGSLDEKKSGASAGPQRSNVRSAFERFQRGASTGGRKGTATKTKHKNIINDIRAFVMDSGRNVKTFSTSGIDGRIFHWKP